MEEVNVGEKKHTVGNGMFAALYYATFCMPSFRQSFKFFRTSIVSLDPETVQLRAFSILSAMFTGARLAPREAKPRFGTALKCCAYDCETHLSQISEMNFHCNLKAE